MALDAGTAYVDIQPSVGAGFFSGLSSKFAGASGAFKAIGVGVGGAIALGIGAGVAAFKIGDTFDQAFDTIRIGTGAVGEDLEGLKEDFKDVFANVPASAQDAATAIADLNTRTGQTGQELQDLATATLDLSRLTGEDLAGTIDKTTRLFGDWGVATDDQVETLDKLYRAGQASGTSINDLATGVVAYGAPLRALGYTMDESIALFAKWNKEGVNTEAIMGGMKQAVGRLAKEGKDVPKAFAEIQEAILNAGSQSEATAIAIETFGTRAGPDLAAAILEGRFELDEMVSAIQDGQDTISTAADDTESFGEKWKKFANKLMVAVEPIATRVFEGMGNLMDAVGPHIGPLLAKLENFFGVVGDGLRVMGDWWNRNRDTILGFAEQVWASLQPLFAFVQDVFTTIVGFFQRTGDEGEALGGRWAAIWEGIQEVFAVAAEFLQVWIGALQSFWEEHGDAILRHVEVVWNAIQQVIDGTLQIIKGIFDVFIAIFTGDWERAWEGIKSILSGAWEILKGIFNAMWSAIKLGFELLWDAVQLVWDRLWGSIKSAASSAIDTVKGWVQGFWENITGKFEEIKSAVTETWDKLWNGLKETASNAWETFLGWIGDAWRLFKGWWSDVWGKLGGAVEDAFNGLVGVVKTALNAVIRTLESGINAAIRGINKAIRGANVINPFKDIPYVPEVSLPRLAQGGDITGAGFAVVGEEGPEPVWLPEGAQVRPNSAMPAAAVGGRVDITVMLDGREIAKAVGAPLMDQVVLRTGVRRSI